MKQKKFIKTTIIEYLNEQQKIEDVSKYLGNTFDVQDSTDEITVGKRKDDWGLGDTFRERVENAGDILRELSSRGNKPDCRYIEEKVAKLVKWLNKDFTVIPPEIKTLEDFTKSDLKWSDAVDSREFVLKFYPKILKQTINEYENIPVHSKETKVAKDLVLNLLKGNKKEFLQNLKEIQNICDKIKKESFITFTSLNESSDSDIMHNNEAKRVYNKLKKNIQTIDFTPTPNGDETDFTKDSIGKMHVLKGVKFNLNKIDKKYDLDILLVNTLGRGSSHHYDYKTNRLVFFIITQNDKQLDFEVNSRLARLRFDSWITEEVFIHEFTHFLDKNRYGNTYSFSTPENDSDYYNSPEEYNAYTHEIIKQIVKNKRKLVGLSFDVFLKKVLKFGKEEFIKNLNNEYMRKLKNRLYKLHTSLNNEVGK